MSRVQNAGQSHNIKTNNSSIQRVEQFKYLGTTIMNQFFLEEIQTGNACYHSVQNLLSSVWYLKI